MRFQKHFLALSLVALSCFALLIAGCGSDDTPTKETGSLNDPGFVAVQTQVNSFLDSTAAFIESTLGTMGAVSTYNDYIDPIYYGPVQPDSDVVSVTYVDGWHVVYINRVRDTYGVVLRDSIQFFKDDAVFQSGVDSDSLYYRHKWLYTVGDTSVSYGAFTGSTDLVCTGLNGITTTVNGDHYWFAKVKNVTDNGTTWREIEITADLNNFTVNKTLNGWDSGCPVSGTITATIESSFKSGDAAPVNTTWSLSLSFNNGTMSAQVERGNYVWSYSRNVCTIQN